MQLAGASRTVLMRSADLALADLLVGERESIETQCRTPFDEDPDDRPVLFQLFERRAALLDLASGSLLGVVTWRVRPYGDTTGCTAWNVGIKLIPAARGNGVASAAARLLARFLFDTTELERVEAYTEAANLPGQRSLEKAGFHREGIARGAHLRGGRYRDLVLFSLLRSDLV